MTGPTPWRRWLEIGLGAMGLSPRDFWDQSLAEWDARVAGFMEMHGGGAKSEEALSRAELDALMAEHPDDAPALAPAA